MYHRHRLPTDTTVRQLAEAWLSYIESQVRQGQRAPKILLPTTKTGQSVIPLGPDSIAAITEQLDRVAGQSEYVFPSPRSWQRPIAANTVWQVFHQLCGEAGIHGAHPHDMRHGWVFTALAGGVSLEHTSEGVGHRSQGTTRRIYGAGVNLTPGMLGAAEAVERIKAEAVKALREPS